MSLQVYDDFGKVGYSLTDYNEKWMTPNGLGEMAVEDTRSFSGGRLHLSAVPFQTGSDAGVDDHRKYLAVSAPAFPVPPDGTLVLSARQPCQATATATANAVHHATGIRVRDLPIRMDRLVNATQASTSRKKGDLQ